MKTLEILCKKHLTTLCLTSIMLFCSSVAQAEFRHFNDWTKKEQSLYAANILVAYIDHKQTNYGLDNGYSEKNPLYGNRHPDKSIAINALAYGAVYWAVGHYAEDETTTYLLGGLLSRTAVVVHNDSIGVSWKVAF